MSFGDKESSLSIYLKINIMYGLDLRRVAHLCRKYNQLATMTERTAVYFD